ncbi:MAG: glycosyltransferase family 4 protein [Candidatus Zhuqueibacterota bacterium]
MISMWYFSCAAIWLVSVVWLFFGNAQFWFFRQNMMWLFLLGFSFLSSLILTPLMRPFARKLKAVDEPNASRKFHSKATPLMGGLAIFISFVAALCLSLYFSYELRGVLLAAGLIIVMGLIDDIRGLSPQVRLAGQIIATFILIKSGIILNLFPDTTWGILLDCVLTFAWVIGITNAFNFMDGLDGVASGIGIICSLIFSIIAIQTHQHTLTLLAISLMGACLGFIPYNFRRNRPALIFLGDSGSTFIGFLLAVFALMGEWAEGNTIKAISIPLLILGILIFDLGYVMVSRIVTQKVHSIREFLDYTGRDHMHHRLLAVGFSAWQTSLMIFILTTVFGLTAILLRHGHTVDAFIGVGQMVLMLLSVTFLMRKGGDFLNGPIQEIKVIGIDELGEDPMLTQLALPVDDDEYLDLRNLGEMENFAMEITEGNR